MIDPRPLVLALILAAAPALAADPAPPRPGGPADGAQERPRRPEPPSFAELDRDADGTVSFEEMRDHHEARLRQRFERMDADGDGRLSEAELVRPAGRGPRDG